MADEIDPNGASIVFLHGFSCSPQMWDPVLDRLPAVRAHCPWLPGHGPDFERVGATYEDLCDHMVHALRHIPEDAFLVAYSLGARVAFGLLQRRPFAGAMLLAGHLGLSDEHARKERIENDARWAALLVEKGIEHFDREWRKQPVFTTQQSLPDALLAVQREQRALSTPEGLAYAMNTLSLGAMPNHRPWLARNKLPLHFVVGLGDHEKFRAQADEVEAHDWGAVHRVPDVGHNIALEKPDVVAGLIESTLL